MTKRISAIDRLRGLPEVFTTKTLAGFLETDRKGASVYLNRWRQRGLVSSLGPQAGMHFNLLRNPDAESERCMEAVAYLFPGAVLGGASVLHGEGWITQIPRKAEVMVPKRASLPRLHDISLHMRQAEWFALAKRNILRPGPVPALAPAFALADCWTSGHWRADPDDIEWDMVPADRLEKAFSLFGQEIPDAWKRHGNFGWTQRTVPPETAAGLGSR